MKNIQKNLPLYPATIEKIAADFATLISRMSGIKEVSVIILRLMEVI